jgi:CheY-like chemotaxis protein
MRACAYVVSPTGRSGTALMDLAKGLGFDAVVPYQGVAAAEQQTTRTPLLFFLCAATPEMRSLKAVADAIRFFPSPGIRFSPLIYFDESPSLEVIRQCIAMGFDDVITLPFTRERVEERLLRQVDRPQVYFETPSYFGPDRRDRLESEPVHSLRGTGGQFRRLEIIRNPLRGVHVLRDDVHLN